jgi:VanZ family protein
MGRLPLRHPQFWLIAGWAMVAFIAVMCELPGKDVPDLHVSDKLEHATAYLGLTMWFTGIYPRSSYWRIALYFFAMGVLVEVFQYLLHLGRTADIHDVAANTLGIVVALVVSYAGLGGWAQRVESLWQRA